MEIRTLIAGVAFAVAMPVMANAAAINFDGGTGTNTGTVITGDSYARVDQSMIGGDGLGASISFNFGPSTNPNFLAYSEFTVDSSFTLAFDDYDPDEDRDGEAGSRSGFQLYAGSFDGSLVPLYGSDTCGSDVNAAFGSTQCVFITGDMNTGTPYVTPVSIYGPLEAGTYVLMFSEGNTPAYGSAEFIIDATPVPVPAAGLLLLGGLGGLAALKRRKKA